MSLQQYRRPSSLAAAAGVLYRNRGTIAPYVRSGLQRARQYMSSRQNQRRAGRRMRRGKGPSYSGQGITEQYDVANIYRKKSMPRYKKRRWRKFIKKVNAVSERDLGSRTVVFNDQLTQTANTANQQGVLTLALYPQKSSNNWLNDISAISAIENFEANPTTAAGITIEKSTKFLFQSGVLDLTVRNTSFQTDATSTGCKLELDVYEIYMSKDAIIGTSGQNNLSSVFAAADADTKVIGGGANTITIQSRGVTPWDVTYALSRYGVKIQKKRKYFLEAGGTFTYQMRDPSRYVLDQNDMFDRAGCNRRKMTKFLYLFYKAVPGITVGTSAGEFQQQISVGVTRKYLYKIEGANDDRDQVITGAVTVGNPN